MGKKAGRVLGIASAIFIPWAAPKLVSMFAASSLASGTALGAALGTKTGFTLGSAVTGAALGGGTAALTGGDVRRSAIMGGIGGGIGGFMQYAPPASPSSPLTLDGGATATATNLSGTGATLSQPAAVDPVTGFQSSPGVSTTAAPASPLTLNGAATTTNLSGAGFSPPAALMTPGAPGPFTMQAGLQPVSQAAATAAGSKSIMDAFREVPGEMAGRLKDPKALADLTLKAGQLALGHTIAGDGMSSEERRMLEEYAENLRQLQSQNMALFNERMDVARRIIQEADDFDPSVFGMQAAANQQIAAGQAIAEGTRGLTGDRRAAAERMYRIGAGRGVGQAFTQGVEAGYGVRDNIYAMGLQGMPGEMAPVNFGPIFTAYSGASERARREREDIGALFQTFSQPRRKEDRG